MRKRSLYPLSSSQNSLASVWKYLYPGDPLLRELKSRVVRVAEAQIAEPPAAKGRAKQKKKTTDTPSSSGAATPIPIVNGNGHANGHSTAEGGEAKDKGKLWEISLEDTVIFPEGGGQPFDTGLMILDEESSGVTGQKVELVIEGCLRRKLESVHLVRVPSQSEDAVKQLEGKEVIVKVDWERRMDHVSRAREQELSTHLRCRYIRLNTSYLLYWTRTPKAFPLCRGVLLRTHRWTHPMSSFRDRSLGQRQKKWRRSVTRP